MYRVTYKMLGCKASTLYPSMYSNTITSKLAIFISTCSSDTVQVTECWQNDWSTNDFFKTYGAYSHIRKNYCRTVLTIVHNEDSKKLVLFFVLTLG